MQTRLRVPLVLLLGLAACGRSSGPLHLCFHPASELQLGYYTDSNSPALWSGGRLRIYHGVSTNTFSEGSSLASLGSSGSSVELFNVTGRPETMWLEAVYRRRDGRVFGIYHYEEGRFDAVRCGVAGFDPKLNLSIPKVGILVSDDDGLNWHNLGVVLEPPASDKNCDAMNGDFAAGNGDPDVAAEGQYLYVYYGNYGGPAAGQGISVSRIALADLDAPVGKAWKWDGQGFTVPGLGGPSTPLSRSFVARVPYGGRVDSFWGPSIHYNTTLQLWVMVMNRTHYDGPWYSQEGSYVSFSRHPSDPAGWSAPEVFARTGAGEYPEFIGEKMGETDRRIGAQARFFESGKSSWDVEFVPGDEIPTGCQNYIE